VKSLLSWVLRSPLKTLYYAVLSAVPFYAPIVHYAATKRESAKTLADQYEWIESGYNLSQF